MQVQAFAGVEGRAAKRVELLDPHETDWLWIDIELGPESQSEEMESVIGDLGLDRLAVSDAFSESDLPKLNDFDGHLLVVLHGIAEDGFHTYELDCFLTSDTLVTIRRDPSPSVEVFAKQILRTPELSNGGASEIFARLADVILRRYLRVLDDLDDRVDELTDMALEADPDFLEELTVVRGEVGELRHVLRPQREVIDQLRRKPSSAVTDGGRRRFSDVFDIADRSVRELESARTALAETLGAYRGAEARQATEVTKVLTIYAAIMLPLSLIAGVFGMNFVQIPASQNDRGWWIVVGVMAGVAAVSLGLFAAAGWIRLPGARRGRRLRRLRLSQVRPRHGIELAEALYKPALSSLRVRTTRRKRSSS